MRRTLALSPLVVSLLLGSTERIALAAPSTTLVISEFRTTGSSGGNDEFVEIFNLTSAPFDASGYQLSGSNSSGSTSVRFTIPNGTLIPARGFLLAANSSPSGYSGAVVPDIKYTTGITDDGGLALLNKSGAVVDAVGLSAGSKYKEGTVLAPLTSGQDASYRRKNATCSPDVDTDNNASDFVKVSPSTPQNLTSCCLDTQCTKPPAGQCYSGTCDTTKGTCSYAIAPGKSCDDGNTCTTGDVCGVSGTCQGGTVACDTPPPPTCLSATTQRSYTQTGTCSGGACSYAPIDTTCPCNMATGTCQDPCAGVTCTTPPNTQCFNPTGLCNAQTGACGYTKKSAGTACDDAQPCTVSDQCDATGACVGSFKVCTPPPAECVGASSRVYTDGTCNAATGACSFTQTDTPCAFGCDGVTGACKPNPCSGVSCVTPPNSCYQAVGICDTTSGQCVYTPKPSSTACDDGLPCTDTDVCNGAGVCAGSAKVCSPPPPQCVGNTSRSFAGGTCNAATGACSFAQTDTPCPSGCDGATGLCKNDPCAMVTCNQPPSSCHQSAGTCNAGVCTYALKPENAQCDDKDPCTGPDRCTAAGACVGATVVCNTPPAASCTSATTSLVYAPVGTCSGGTCAYAANATSCAFGCDAGSGLCTGDPCTDISCTTPPSGCHVALGTCANGACSYGLKQMGAACDDGDLCTTNDACNVLGVCTGSPKSCTTPPAPFCLDGSTSRSAQAQGSCQSDGSCQYTTSDTPCALGCDGATGLCTTDLCTKVTCNQPPSACHTPVGTCTQGTCSYALLQPGAACNDQNPCTTSDACDASGACLGVTKVCNAPPPPECTGAKESQSAAATGTCSPIDGSCGYDVATTTCATKCDLATGLCVEDPCTGMTCDKPPSKCHLPLGQCSAGACTYTLAPSGTACDDGEACTTSDACDAAGTCQGTPGPGCGGSAGASGQGGAAGKAGAGGAGAGGTSGAGGKAGAGGASGGQAGTAGKSVAGAGGAAAGAGGTAGGAGQAFDPGAVANAPGCGCAVPGRSETASTWTASLSALALGLVRRGRTRARRRAG